MIQTKADPVDFFMSGWSSVTYHVGLLPENIASRLQENGMVLEKLPLENCAYWDCIFPFSERDRVLEAIAHPPNINTLEKMSYIASVYHYPFPSKLPSVEELGINHLSIDHRLAGRIVTDISFVGRPHIEKFSLWRCVKESLAKYL